MAAGVLGIRLDLVNGQMRHSAFCKHRSGYLEKFRGNLSNKYYADTLYRGHYIPGAGRLVQVNMTARF